MASSNHASASIATTYSNIIEKFHESYTEAAEELDVCFAFCRTHSKTAIFNGLRSGKTTVITWWEGQMEFNNLRDVTLKLFSLVLWLIQYTKEIFRTFLSFTPSHAIASATRLRGSVSIRLCKF